MLLVGWHRKKIIVLLYTLSLGILNLQYDFDMILTLY